MVEAEWEPFAETLITVVGMTMSRGFDLKACDFNPSPGQYVVTDEIRAELEKIRDLQDIADSCGEVFRFSPNVFSPPPWMKENGLCDKGDDASTNKLKPEHYDEFASMCSAFVRVCIDTFGITPFAFSPQNEPAFPEPYASCVYTARTYTQMVRFVGPAVEAANPSTLIYGVEHVLWAFPGWEMTVVHDSVAGPYFDRFAFHGASNDVSVDIDTSQKLQLTRTYPREKWVSEYNWQGMNYDTSFIMATILLNELGDGANIIGYMAGGRKVLWDASGNLGGGTLPYSPSFYIHSQFMRFVRPGMTRVKVTTDEPLLRAISFKNDARGSFSVVMVNAAAQDVEVTLSSTGSLPDSLEMRTTTDATAEEGFIEGPLQDGSSPITVPAKGIVSLGYRIRGAQPVGVHAPSPTRAVQRRMPRERGTVRVFDLRGRALKKDMHKPRPGRQPASVVVHRDANGRAQVKLRGVSAGR